MITASEKSACASNSSMRAMSDSKVCPRQTLKVSKTNGLTSFEAVLERGKKK